MDPNYLHQFMLVVLVSMAANVVTRVRGGRMAMAQARLIERGEAVQPHDQSLLDQTEVSVQNLSPEVHAQLEGHFEGQVEIRDGKLRWIQEPSGHGPIPESTPNDNPSTMGAPYGEEARPNKGAGAMADARRALESAGSDSRGGSSAAPAHDESRPERVARIEREERRLLSWAEQRRLTIQELPPADELHGEHGIRYDRKIGRYVKFTRADKHQGYGIALGSHLHGASPGEYLDRLLLQNELFGDDVRLVGVYVRPGGKLSIVTSQPRIVGEPASTVQIDALMVGRGFMKLADGAFLDRAIGLLIFDMFPRNVIQTEDGTVYPVDPVIQRVTSDFAEFLIRHPERIHDRR